LNEHLEYNSQKYQYSTRGKNKLYIRACKTVVLQTNVINMASRLYNNLPEKIIILDNFRSFKKEVKKLLLTDTFYLIDEYLNFKY
jgi:hypothetical protein